MALFGKESLNRPVLSIPWSPLEYIAELLAIAALVATCAVPALYWSGLPRQVPTHFDLSGNVDAYGSKLSLLVLPVIALLLYILLTVLSLYPHIYNYPWLITPRNAEAQYRNARGLIVVLKLEVMLLFGIIEWDVISAAKGPTSGVGTGLVPSVILIILLTVVLYVARAFTIR